MTPIICHRDLINVKRLLAQTCHRATISTDCAFVLSQVTMTAPTGRDSDKFMLRLPDGMRDRIRDAAEANSRSMNAEIVARLEASLADREPDIILMGRSMVAELEHLIERASDNIQKTKEGLSIIEKLKGTK